MWTSFNIPIHKPFLPKGYQWYWILTSFATIFVPNKTAKYLLVLSSKITQSAFNDLESTSMSNDTDRTYVKLQVCGNDGSPDIQKDVDFRTWYYAIELREREIGESLCWKRQKGDVTPIKDRLNSWHKLRQEPKEWPQLLGHWSNPSWDGSTTPVSTDLHILGVPRL